MDKEKYIIENFFLPLAGNDEALQLQNDAALLKKQNLVVSTDMMVEDQHFKKNHDPKILAKKLLRINLSDIAAMGATPYGFFLNLALPKNNVEEWIKKFSFGLSDDMKLFDIKLFGGDLSQSSKIFLSMTILGKIKNKCHNKNYSNINSDIYVSGNIGDAPLGFEFSKNFNCLNGSKINKLTLINKFNLPEPRVNIGLRLLNKVDFCTDISDGLVREIFRVANYSKIQANIFIEDLPISVEAKSIINMNEKRRVFEIILNGGEDYELLFSARSENRKIIEKIKNIKRIGNFSKGSGLNIYDKNHQNLNLVKKGFSHF